MLNINIFATARALNVVEIKEHTFVGNHITRSIFQNRITFVANNLPRLFLRIVVVFNNFHTSYYITKFVPN